MKKLKRLFGDLTAATVSIFLLCLAITAPYQVEVHATAPGPLAYTAPSDGAGRIVLAETEQETSVDTPETETAEIEPYIAPEEVIETEAVSASYQQVTGKLETEEFVEVFPEADPVIETDIDALIVQVASEYGLPWELVRAVCYVESGFDPNAISVTGDYGLMQVSYVNHGWLGLTDPLDPEANLRAGCTILKTALDNSDGDFTKALMRYNRGDAYAMSQWSQGIFSTAYTERVLGKYYELLRGEH